RTRGRRLTLALAFRLSARRGRPLSLLLLVHELADLLRRGLERLHRGLDPVGVVGLERVAQGGELLLDVLLRVGGHLVTEVLERLLDGVRERVRLVARLDPLAVAAVVLGVHLRILDEARDLVLREAARRGDGDVLLATGRLVLCLHIHDAVRIDVEAHLDLRDPPRRGRYAVEDEASEALVVCGKLALALNDVDLDLRLPVARGREDLRLRGRDRAVALDELGGDATERPDAERERRDVEEEDVLDLPLEHAGLDRGAHRDDLVRVHALVRLLAGEELADGHVNYRRAGQAPDDEQQLYRICRSRRGRDATRARSREEVMHSYVRSDGRSNSC